jgi:hypothetical protein
MKIDNIRNILENAYVIQTEETFLQFAGLEFDSSIIEEVTKIKIQGCQLFLKRFDSPRELFLASLETLADDKTKDLEQKLHETRNTKVFDKRYKIGDNYVNWNNWRQFSAIESNHQHRKNVFDCFVEKTSMLEPIIDDRFTKIREIYEIEGRMNPLEGYLESENITLSSLIEFIENLVNHTKKMFEEQMVTISNRMLGRSVEYFDDFYYFRNQIFKEISSEFEQVDPILSVTNTLSDLGMDTSRISYDTVDRKNKYPSPICFFVKIPSDIRILYRKESPYFDFQGCYHESGHAMHATSIRPDLEYEKKYHIPMGITETFSIFFDRLARNNHIYKKK